MVVDITNVVEREISYSFYSSFLLAFRSVSTLDSRVKINGNHPKVQ